MTRRSDDVDKDALIASLIERNAVLVGQVDQLLAQVAQLLARIAELESKSGPPPKTPKNSSVPPSKGQKPSGSKSAKQKARPHAGANRPLHPNPTRKRDVLAQACDGCGADLSGVAQTAREVYDRIELPEIVPDVTRVSLFGGVCPCCTKGFKAAAPQGLEPGSPFGPNLRAFVIYLRTVQGIPLARLSRLLHELIGLEISEGALVNILAASRGAFATQADRIKAQLTSGTVIASDETGLRVGKSNHWLWVFHHADSAVFVADEHRTKEVVATFLDDYRPEYWISDRMGSQAGWASRGHQVCLAHLIRDTQYAIDCGDTVLGPGFKAILQQACGIGTRRHTLADSTLNVYESKLSGKLDRLMTRSPTSVAGRKLERIIKKVRHQIFLFVTRRQLSATNNGSERALRHTAVYRKITNGFRSRWASQLYADIRSVVETGRRRAISAIDAIRFTLDGTPLTANA